MLASWINILPLFVVKMLARRFGERLTVCGWVYAQATRGVLVVLK